MCHRLFLFLLLVPYSYSFSCIACDGDDCLQSERWLTQACPPRTSLCFRLQANGQIFRRGCAPFDCDEMKDVPMGASCSTCDSSRCNGIRQIYLEHPGGGATWKNCATVKMLLSTVLPVIMFI